MSGDPRDGTAADGGTRLAVCEPSRVGKPRLCRLMLSGFSHRCRNSLNGIKLGLYLFKRGPACPASAGWLELEANYRTIEKYFDRLQTVNQLLRLTLVQTEMGRWLNDWDKQWQASFAGTGFSLVMDPPPEEVTGVFDPHYLGQALDALVTWRAKTVTSGEARLTWGVAGDDFIIEWREAGHRNSATGSDEPKRCESAVDAEGSSLALLVLNRIVKAHSGIVQRADDEDFRLMIMWPRELQVAGSSG